MTSPESWETDVIVIGYGGSGAAAAITAHDNGAQVIVLEKMSIPGGNTAVSGGNMTIPRDPERFTQYLNTLCFGTTEPEIIDTFVKGLMENLDWIRQMGGELRKFVSPPALYSFFLPELTFPGIPDAGEVDAWCVKESETVTELTGGGRLYGLLARQVQNRGIKVMLSTPARELITNQKGEIVGVIAESEGKSISIRARRGVVLACGGFENDDALKWDYLTPKPLYFTGNPGNTGDGIRMAQKVGAALWHMSSHTCKYAFKASEHEAAFSVDFSAPGFIWVDKHGRRFINEGQVELYLLEGPLSEFDYDRFEYPRIPFYAIFDEEVKRKAALCYGVSGYVIAVDKYKWSPDNSAEIKKGWITRAKSISELAKQISMDGSTLENTIAKYNEYCKVVKDADFGRPGERLKAIDGPPYYAMPLWPALLNTQGGPRRDKSTRVLDPDGNPIPRLYAAGEFGSIWGFLYQTATNMDEALVFGRVAGRNAALSQPVEP